MSFIKDAKNRNKYARFKKQKKAEASKRNFRKKINF